MGWLAIVCAAIAAFLYYILDLYWLLWPSVGAGAIALWSYGVMHNYAMEAAKTRPGFSGRFDDITAQEADTAPNWVTTVNLLSSLAAFALLAGAIFMIVTR